MLHLLSRLSLILLFPLLAACAPPPPPGPPPPVPGYEGIQDGEFYIQPVDAGFLPESMRRTQVAYNGPEGPGTIVVDTRARRLYYVDAPGSAIRYAIAVGREGSSFVGSGTIQRKQEWPSWTPTANMVRARPDLYAAYAGGLPGGLMNPLGARALYLYRNGRDTYFRIHGTAENSSIGRATSAGCIRLFNQDAIDLYNRVPMGSRVQVRTAQESMAYEGPMMEDALGRMMPYDAALAAQAHPPVVQPMAQPVVQPATQPVGQPVVQPVIQPWPMEPPIRRQPGFPPLM